MYFLRSITTSALCFLGIFLILLKDVSSWSNGPNLAVTNRGFEKKTLESDPATALQEYIDRAGATRYCEIGTTKYGRGLVATKNLEPGETVLSIPLKETIIVEQSESEPSVPISDSWAGQLANELIKRQSQAISDDNNAVAIYSRALPPPPPTPSRGDWSIKALETLGDIDIRRGIEAAQEWRNDQWEMFGVANGALGDQQRFLDALDLVSSRTIRCGSKFMLVPFLDMANYASRNQGGGYYKLTEGSSGSSDGIIELKIGDRGCRVGDEIFLDYGDRTNEEWLIYYGFLPDRNSAESLVLPVSQRTITWDNVAGEDEGLKEECRAVLDNSSTSLADDIIELKKLESGDRDADVTMVLALKYRIAQKTLLTAVAGVKTSSAFTSVFL